ncbi:pantoate--beta-alanine ligase [Bacillus sp. HMF5848]|uniref:pantoate--beta-alanine ligase n=1 Tax=Bacillus sp. HMF5848 TaxID=2495421 RepID=UPI000F7930C3|nr:pantoate--beta-alanine ligase [Bacillus sp. HMF5848]RSK27404.1 pantoate--beta-alanine ligase [Bacillus sp. HMF5848]
MKTITSIRELQSTLQSEKLKGKTIGFVPTMGYLHEGHLSLLQKARTENDIVVLSIFVNPLQFGPNEDFDSYPRDYQHDENLAKDNSVDFIFYPTKEEMYPNELTASVVVHKRINVLCGRKREGHFDGVATVVTKLFNIVMPHRAYFGMKDAQQVAVIEGLIKDLNMPITIVPCETVRENDGLAKSSRNVYLSEKERDEAPTIYQSLQMAKSEILEGETSPLTIIHSITEHITKFTSGTIDYVEIYSYPELKLIEKLRGRIVVAVAVKFSKARLIDNITLTIPE